MDPAHAASSSGSTAERSFALAWTAWMAACVGVMACFAWRIPLAAKPALPIEDGAMVAVGMVAILLASWMAPVLLVDRSKTLFCAASITPVLLCADLLRGLPIAGAIPSVAITLCWLAGLHVAAQWRALIQAFALASALGAALWYLAQEFSPVPAPGTSALWAVSPTLGAATIFSHSAWKLTPFAPPLALIALGAAFKWARSRPLQGATTTSLPPAGD